MFKQAVLVIFLSVLCCAVVRAQENPIAWKEGGLLYCGEIKENSIYYDGHSYWTSSDSGRSWKILTDGLWRDGTMPDNSLWTGISNDCLILYNATNIPNPWENVLGRGFYYLSIENRFWEYIRLPQESYDSVRLISMITISSDTMLALFRVGNKSILYRTFDHGNTWSDITGKISDRCYIQQITSYDHDNLVVNIFTRNNNAEFDGPFILRSTDEGETWVKIGSDLPDSCNISIFSNDGFGNALCVLNGTIDGKQINHLYFVTLDGFNSFQPFPMVFHTETDTLYSYSAIYLLDNKMFLTVETFDTLGNVKYRVLYSLDSGKLWKYVRDPENLLTGYPSVARFLDGYMIISDGYYLLENLDSVSKKIQFGPVATGFNRKITIVNGSNLSTTWISDQSYVQTSSYVTISNDDGVTWGLKKNDSILLANTKWYFLNNMIYAPGVKDSNACILTSTDNGDSWLPLSYIAKGVAAHWVQVSHDTIVTMLSSKQVYISVDHGASWREVTYSASPFLASIEPIYVNGKVFCVTQDGRSIVRYSFASDLWNVITMPDTLPLYGQYSGGGYFNGKLYMFTNYNGYDTADVTHSLVYRSNDLGETWNVFDTGLPDSANVSSYTINNNTLYVLVSDMIKGAQPDINLFYLGKGNDSWQSTSISSYLPSEVYASESYVYLKNDRGLYRYPVSVVSVPVTEDVTSNIFDIYPNPASTSVTIRQGDFGAVSYICTDIAGKMYQFGKLLQAADEIKIDVRTLPNGSYTLRLQNADGEVASRRFVVVK